MLRGSPLTGSRARIPPRQIGYGPGPVGPTPAGAPQAGIEGAGEGYREEDRQVEALLGGPHAAEALGQYGGPVAASRLYPLVKAALLPPGSGWRRAHVMVQLGDELARLASEARIARAEDVGDYRGAHEERMRFLRSEAMKGPVVPALSALSAQEFLARLRGQKFRVQGLGRTLSPSPNQAAPRGSGQRPSLLGLRTAATGENDADRD